MIAPETIYPLASPPVADESGATPDCVPTPTGIKRHVNPHVGFFKRDRRMYQIRNNRDMEICIELKFLMETLDLNDWWREQMEKRQGLKRVVNA